MSETTGMVILLFIFFSWIPILAIGSAVSKILDSKNNNKCIHDLEYDEIRVVNFNGDFSNINVSVTCKKCGYHKNYEKY